MKSYDVFHGRKLMTVNLPDNWDVYEVPMPNEEPLSNPVRSLVNILENPTASPPLRKTVKPDDQIAICVTDVSRPCPDFILLPPILEELEKAGVKKQNITILIAVGEHRPVTADEMKVKFGYFVYENYRIINHDARDRLNLADLGGTKSGAPIVVNSLLAKVDHIITVGVVDPHQYAGFSGGAKTVAVGCAGEETIKHTHSASFLEISGPNTGVIKGNRFHQTLWDIVEPLPFNFAVNAILNEKGEILDLAAGRPKDAHEILTEKAMGMFIHEVDCEFDIAYFGCPRPKDINLYQATRAATYQALMQPSALKKGSIINLVCECPEGFGKGVGETRFREKLTRHPDPASILASMSGKESLPGEQRAFMTVKTMILNPINVVGANISPHDLEKACFLCRPPVPPEIEREKIKAVVMKDGAKKVLRRKVG